MTHGLEMAAGKANPISLGANILNDMLMDPIGGGGGGGGGIPGPGGGDWAKLLTDYIKDYLAPEPEIVHFDDFSLTGTESNTISPLMQEGDTLYFDMRFDEGNDGFAYFEVNDNVHIALYQSSPDVVYNYEAQTEGLHSFEWGVEDVTSTLYVENIYIVQA